MIGTNPVILKAGGGCCTISVVPENLTAHLKEVTRSCRGLILMDLAFKKEAAVWQELFPTFRVIYPKARGEAVKTWNEARRLLTILAEENYARDDWLIVRGGGSLTDLGAFCGGLYRRGLKLALVATTLLAAVDAAVGGKTAINFGGAKNQVGHFYLPELVLVDLAAFRSLPRIRLAEGLVEAYKTGLLFDRRLAELVNTRTEELLAGDSELLAEIAQCSFMAKATLVVQDFREKKGLREILNLGHTYGHVVEFYSKISHGAAVARGLSVVAEISQRLTGLPAAAAAEIRAVAERLGGPWPVSPPAAEISRLLKTDKKIRGGRLHFVALEDLERPRLIEVTAGELIQAAKSTQNTGQYV
ncbi:MAG: hypothetical protein AMR96_04160 [Candidatus Adiutrix intracellularis]|nr:MAG: hypothetical protein AMR96_04160 [Candidatus Adiutrix intracellularis]